MNLVLIRHAIAEDRADFARTGLPDDQRPLTERGRKRMLRAAQGLRTLVPHLDLLTTSPLVRAAQTADILSAAYDGLEPIQVEALAPGGDPADLLGWLAHKPEDSVVVAVGHEPDLSDAVSWFTTAAREDFLRFKKGAAACLSFEGALEPGQATLEWFVPPAALRGIGG